MKSTSVENIFPSFNSRTTTQLLNTQTSVGVSLIFIATVSLTLISVPGGAGVLSAPLSPERVEAPVTIKAYLLCVFASFGGIFFG